MDIKILGTGCAKCEKLAELTGQAAKEMQLNCSIEKVTDITEIMKYKVMMTPGLVVNGEVKLIGKVPPIEDIKKILGEG